MTSELKLEVVTPFGKTYSDLIKSCTIPGADGQFQILKGHATLISIVNVGIVKIEKLDENSLYLATSGGYCEVKDDQIQVIAESAEYSDKIDVARAKAAQKRALERISSKADNIDTDRAKLALMRALNRIKIAELR